MAWEVFDRKFRQYPAAFVFQSALAALAATLLMLFHDLLRSPALLASLGASAFLAFTAPHADWSHPRRLIGGYLCGVLVGTACHYLLASGWLCGLGLAPPLAKAIIAGWAVGLAVFAMVVLNLEHAPAAGIALGLVLDAWHPWNVAYVVGSILVLCLVKQVLKPIMRDLI